MISHRNVYFLREGFHKIVIISTCLVALSAFILIGITPSYAQEPPNLRIMNPDRILDIIIANLTSTTNETALSSGITVYVVDTDDNGKPLAPGVKFPDQITVRATRAVPSSFVGSPVGTIVALSPGSFVVEEKGFSGIRSSFGGCSGTIESGEFKTCIIYNRGTLLK